MREAIEDLESLGRIDAAEAGAISVELAGRLRPSAGMRNVIVRAYADLDLELVAAALPHAVQDYGDYVVEVATFLRTRSP